MAFSNMTLALQADPVPLREDADGALRVGNTRVLLEMVIGAFERGATPETIVESYSVLQLNDVYAVITYYLNHRDEVQQYLERRRLVADEVRAAIEAGKSDDDALRARIRSRRAELARP
jgi:uncharacterized protein (DUF433 family)